MGGGGGVTLAAIYGGFLVGGVHCYGKGAQALEGLVGDFVDGLAVFFLLLVFVVLRIELEGATAIDTTTDKFEGAVAEVAFWGFQLKLHCFLGHTDGEVAFAAVATSDGGVTLMQQIELDVLRVEELLGAGFGGYGFPVGVAPLVFVFIHGVENDGSAADGATGLFRSVFACDFTDGHCRRGEDGIYFIFHCEIMF